MNNISIPWHLLIPILLSITCLIIVISKRKIIITNRSKKLFVSVLIFLVLYIIIVGNSLLYDIYYQFHLNSYDLDGNGFFDGKEINENQKIAMKNLTNDTSRNFSFILGLIFSLIISTFLYIMLSITSKIRKRSKTKTIY